jgi:hypothetical protein
MNIDPFTVETITLYVPVTVGERRVRELSFKPAVFKDVLFAGKYEEQSIPFYAALISSLTGQPELVIGQLCPEDTANAVVIAKRCYLRFTGQINLFEKNEEQDENENPTVKGKTDAPPSASSPASGA